MRTDVIRCAVEDILGEIDPHPLREGLENTPARFAKACEHWFGGYAINPAEIMATFEDGSENYDQMIVRKNIPFYSHCEHHIAPIFGTCTIAYIPNGRIVGLSKLDRLVDAFARRLQVQERFTSQIADAIFEHLRPQGVGVYVNARHLCIESRGVCNHDSQTVTHAIKGNFMIAEVRNEFLALARV